MNNQQHATFVNGAGRIDIFKRGLVRYEKTSYPSRTGIYHEIETADARLHFNLNGEIIRLIGKNRDWPHPQEWLKRTVGNDWIYYSTGGYTGVFETTGEYYLPNLPYATNNHMGGNPFAIAGVKNQLDSWQERAGGALEQTAGVSARLAAVAEKVTVNTPARLAETGARFHLLTDGAVSVLPPDTRHVDYQVIPLPISRGCLYKCGFCRVKNNSRFRELRPDEIEQKIDGLRTLYGSDLINYNAVFLGDHDALNSDPDLIRFAMMLAHRALSLGDSFVQDSHTFMFGSVTSLLKHDLNFYRALDALPGRLYINIGLESAHQETLDVLQKPISAAAVETAFERLVDINASCPTIEVTANFVTHPTLPQGHYQAMLSLIRDRINTPRPKGCIYLSPLQFDNPSRARLFDFYKLKRLSRLPLFMYTIQRL